MKVIEAGHTYGLQSLDGGDWEVLRFVKREGEGYPGNVGAHPGTIIQDVLRACIDRLDYVDNQIPCKNNRYAKFALQQAIWELEDRAAQRHGRILDSNIVDIEKLIPCSSCGHVGCSDCARVEGAHNGKM